MAEITCLERRPITRISRPTTLVWIKLTPLLKVLIQIAGHIHRCSIERKQESGNSILYTVDVNRRNLSL